MTDLPDLIATALAARAAYAACHGSTDPAERVNRKLAADLADTLLADWAMAHGPGLVRVAEAYGLLVARIRLDIAFAAFPTKQVHSELLAEAIKEAAALAALPDGREG